MAKTSGSGPGPTVDLSASSKKPKFSYSFSLKISGSHRSAGANDGITSPMAAAVVYKKYPTSVTKAVKYVLERPGLKVRNITDDSIILIVELDFHMKNIFLSFVEEFEKEKAKVEGKLKNIGFRGELDVTIANREEVDNKVDQIR